MIVRDIMTQNPITAHPSDRVSDALVIMGKHEFKHLPVISSAGHLVGIVSVEDCRIALNLTEVGENIPSSNRQLREIMTLAPIVTSPEVDVFKAAQLMYEHHIHSLPVMLEETLVGIMTTSDLLIACLQLTQSVAV
jgi:acetoin utilization protein AcuB